MPALCHLESLWASFNIISLKKSDELHTNAVKCRFSFTFEDCGYLMKPIISQHPYYTSSIKSPQDVLHEAPVQCALLGRCWGKANLRLPPCGLF